MSTETRSKALVGFTQAVEEVLAVVRSQPFSRPAAGQRALLGEVAPGASLLLEGVPGGAWKLVVRLTKPFVLDVEAPVADPAAAAAAPPAPSPKKKSGARK